MEENRLKSFKRRRVDSSDLAENDHHAVSLLITNPAPPGTQVSFLSGEDSEFFPWTMKYSEMLASEIDDCVSEALPQANFVPYHDQKRTALENQRQILADRVQRSVENLRVLYNRLANMVGLSQGPHRHGDSEPCGLAMEHHSRKNSGEGSSQWKSQATQEALSPVSEGGESKCYHEPEIPSSDLNDLLSSLQLLLSIVEKHEAMQVISQAKLQALREQKEALRLEKQQYRDKCKRQHELAECNVQSSVS